MLLDVPSSLVWLLSLFRPCFTQPTFQTFCSLTVGALARVGTRTVTGMLLGSGMAGSWHHCRAHRFFARARWSIDAVGLVVLDLIVTRLLDPGAWLLVAVDDTLLRRSGPKVFGRQVNYDGAADAPRGHRVAYGNSWVVAGVIVKLVFLERPVCLPVLFRLWRPGHGPTQVELANELVSVIATRYPARKVVALGDGAYAARALSPANVPANVCLVMRVRRNLRLYEPPPPRAPGTLGRPRAKGGQLPLPTELAADAATRWQTINAYRYGQRETLKLTTQHGFWYRGWGCVPIQIVCIRDRHTQDQLEAVILASDPELPALQIIELYAKRWSIEVAFRDAKQLAGVGQAQNRTRLAVQRTAPFGFLTLTLAITWYALYGHQPTDVPARQRQRPWYRTKHEPSVQDMLVKLRRTIIAERFFAAIDPALDTTKIAWLQHAWELTAA